MLDVFYDLRYPIIGGNLTKHLSFQTETKFLFKNFMIDDQPRIVKCKTNNFPKIFSKNVSKYP